jgi:hypothetical protein
MRAVECHHAGDLHDLDDRVLAELGWRFND